MESQPTNQQRAHDLAVAIYASMVKPNDDMDKMAVEYAGLYTILLATLDEIAPNGMNNLTAVAAREILQKYRN